MKFSVQEIFFKFLLWLQYDQLNGLMMSSLKGNGLKCVWLAKSRIAASVFSSPVFPSLHDMNLCALQNSVQKSMHFLREFPEPAIATVTFCINRETDTDCDGRSLAEDHRSRTCPGSLATPTGFEVQPPHRRRRSSEPSLLHGGRRIIGAFQTLTNTRCVLFSPSLRKCKISAL